MPGGQLLPALVPGEDMVFSAPGEGQPWEERCPLGAVAADRAGQTDAMRLS